MLLVTSLWFLVHILFVVPPISDNSPRIERNQPGCPLLDGLESKILLQINTIWYTKEINSQGSQFYFEGFTV